MTTPSTPTSTMKQAEALIDEYGLDCAAMKNRNESELALQARAALLAFIRSLVEAQPSAVPDDYAQRVGQHVTERATQHGWTRDQPEDAFTFMMRRCREVALEDARQPSAVAGEARTFAEHVCGQRGYNGMIDPPCPGCKGAAAPSAVLPLKGELK